MADFWLFALLGGALVFLWRRVDRLEAALNERIWREAPREPVAVPAAATKRSSEASAQAHEAKEPAPVREPPASSTARPARETAAQKTFGGFAELRRRFAFSFDFEDFFGRLLPIWAGGVALAVAGFFIVRWSIEAGLLTISVRVILGFLFGLALLAAAEVAFRFEARVADPRVRQALAGAGLATLYASFYLAGSFYGLIGTSFAFLGLAAVTVAAIALSFRFGLPSAILGLVGGFAAPALVGSEEANLPVLSLYLALVAAGLSFTGRRQDRAWLGIAALAGGLGWGALLTVSAPARGADLIALGAYLVVLGAVLPAFSGRGRPGLWVRVGAAALASVQLAALVHQGGYGPLEWALYFLLGAALAWFGWRFPAMREANAVAAAIGLFLLAFWPSPSAPGFAAVALAIAAIFAAVPVAQLWRTHWRWIDVAQVCGAALGLAAVSYGHFGHFAPGGPEPLLALATLALSGLPALAAWLIWPPNEEPPSRAVLAATACTVALAGFAGLLASPAWAATLVAAVLVGGVAALDRRRPAAGFLRIARGVAFTGFALLIVLPQVAGLVGDELARMFGNADLARDLDWRSPLRWLAAAAAFLPLALREREARWRRVAEIAGVLAVYGAAAQVVPAAALPWTLALAGVVCAWRLPGRAAPATTLAVLVALWAVSPFGRWLAAGAATLVGETGDLASWPTVRDALLRLLPLAALAALLRGALPRGSWRLVLAVVGLVTVHTLYRHGFAALAGDAFVATGMAQRTLWEALLLVGAAVALRRGLSTAAAGLGAAAFAHFAWFTLGLHNPLWSAQAVGPLPFVNWLLPAYAAGVAAIQLLRRTLPDAYSTPRWLADGAVMLLLVFLAISALRHTFSGSLLIEAPMSQTEDLLRSITGILLAAGFLLWGARAAERSWRIGSLVLMLLAVLKVFLFDAAGLEGLARIASFMALGFSLIGIGWFYARQLKTVPQAPAAQPA